MEVESEEEIATGTVDRISWPELAEETPIAESRIARWRRTLADQGYEV